jgi:phytoene synthase
MSEAGLAGLLALVRDRDPDRYLTTLFAPAARREALLALYAFNFEVAKLREVTREPIIGQIRLQWWRDAIDEIYRGTTPRRHEIVEPLAAAIRESGLTRYHFDRLIAARETDLLETPPSDLAALRRYAEDSSGRLLQLALEILGVREPVAHEAAREVGIGFALAGLLRALPVHLRLRHATLPADLAATIDQRLLFELKPSAELGRAVKIIAEAAADALAGARRHRHEAPRAALPALLPARLAETSLRRLRRAGYNPFDPRLAQPDTLASWRLALAAALGRY